MGLLETLGLRAQGHKAGPDDDTETVRKIAAALDQLDPARARHLAAFAFLLTRVALADQKISEEEARAMERIVREKGDFPEAQAVMVVQMAKTQAIALGGTENYLVTRQFKEISNRAQRVDLLRCLFAVAAADQTISHVENSEITAVGLELGFSGEEVASIRAAYRDQLSVLKGQPA